MKLYLPNGSVVSMAATYGTAKAMSSISNAVEAVATLEATHGVVANDVLEVSSGWGRLDGRVAVAKSVSTNDVTLKEIDTSSTTLYTAGGGVGTVREVLTWVEFDPTKWEPTGGEQQFAETQPMTANRVIRAPSVKSAVVINFEVADDPSKPYYDAMIAADEDKQARIIRVVSADGLTVRYYNGFVSLNKIPTGALNQFAMLKGSISLVAEPTVYQ